MAEPVTSDATEACPDSRDIALLGQWQTFNGALQRLNEILLAELEATAGVTLPGFVVVWHLFNAPERSAPMGDLAQILRFSTAGTTKLIDRLAEAGLVERRTHASDRRVTLATLTPAGAGVAVRASSAAAAALRRHIVAPLGDEGFATLVRAVSGIAPAGDATGNC
jgi:DNA-binding MarR family transcriptional regulator